MVFKDSITRRRLLQGVSSSLLYAPLLRVLRESDAFAAGESRLLVVYFPAGSYKDSFFPQGTPSSLGAFPVVTKALEAHKDDVIFIQGLQHGSADHYAAPGATFTGAAGDGQKYSIDQYLGDTLGAGNLKKSIQLGCCTTLDGAGSQAVSWKKGGQALPAVDDPKAAYADIFGSMFALDNRGGSSSLALADENVKSGKKRVLDYVKNDMKRIETALGPIEGKVFSAHVNALDELYMDIKRQEDLANSMNPGPMPGPGGGNPGPMPGNPGPMPGPMPGNPGGGGMARCDKGSLASKIPQGNSASGKWYQKTEMTPSVNKFQRELMLQAFACNVTRFGLMQWGHSDCAREFFFEGGSATGVTYHSNTHANTAGLHNIQAAIINEVAAMISFFKANNLWDNTLVLFSSDLGDFPNDHNGKNLPVFLAGRMNGKLKGNRMLTFPGEQNTKLMFTANHLVGQATGTPLPGIF